MLKAKFILNAESLSHRFSRKFLFKNIDIGNMGYRGLYFRPNSSTYKVNNNILIEDCNIDSEFTFDYSNATQTTIGLSDGMMIISLTNSVIRNNNIYHTLLFI